MQCAATLPGKAARLLRCFADSLSQTFCRFQERFKTLHEFWQHFWHALLVGAFIEALVALLGGTAVVAGIENTALDAMMRLNADTEKSDRRPVQLFIDVDERTWRSPAWGGGEPKTVPWERVADLIEQVAAWQPRYVLVDFLIEGAQDTRQEAFLARMESVLAQHPESRLLFVRSFRRPLEQMEAQGIRPSYAVDTLMARHPERVFAVAPNFVLSGGQVLRSWRLWESACYPLPEQPGEGVWAVVPSPQLMIAAQEAKDDIPWRLRFADGAEGVTPIAPANPGEGSRCVTGASSVLQEAGYSARLADWQAGKWVQKHLDTCYQQGFFAEADCRSGKPPQPEQSRSTVSADRHLSTRVLFRQSDLAGRHEAALLAGDAPTLYRYGGHFHRISAAGLLEDAAAPTLGRARSKLSAAAAQGQVSVTVIGASYDASHDHHMTPLGLMAGPLVLVNAVDSLQTVGVLQALDGATGWAVMAVTLLVSALLAALFSLSREVFTVFSTLFMCLMTLLALGPLSMWLLKRGVWLDIAAPFIGIYLERELGILSRGLDVLRRAYSQRSKSLCGILRRDLRALRCVMKRRKQRKMPPSNQKEST